MCAVSTLDVDVMTKGKGHLMAGHGSGKELVKMGPRARHPIPIAFAGPPTAPASGLYVHYWCVKGGL